MPGVDKSTKLPKPKLPKPKFITRLDKLPKRKITVDELLGRQDITKILTETLEKRNDIDELLVIYTDNGKGINWCSSKAATSRLIYVMEIVKRALLDEG